MSASRGLLRSPAAARDAVLPMALPMGRAALQAAPVPSRRRCRRRCLRSAARAAGLRVVATSEHWYDEEEEFDALTDAMAAKDVVLVAAPPGGSGGSTASGDGIDVAALRAYLAPLKFAQAFASEQALPFAQQLWAGRDKAPYFLKVRSRAGLDAAAGDNAGAAAAGAAGVWEELLQQNWRVELDAGLGTVGPRSEALLLVAAPAAVEQLLAAAGAAPAGGVAAGSVSVLQVGGTQAGDPLEWRLLAKRLAVAGAAPAAGETVEAVLQQQEAVH